MVVFVVKKEKKKNQTKGISHSRRRHSCDALSRVREPVYSHTHTHCIYLCNLQNPKSTLDQNARTSKKSLFVFLVCYKRVIHQYLLEEQKHGDEESDAVGHGESRRRCPRWYPRNRHTEYVFTLVLIGGWLFTDWLIDVARVLVFIITTPFSYDDEEEEEYDRGETHHHFCFSLFFSLGFVYIADDKIFQNTFL